jgi:hypothetical protein
MIPSQLAFDVWNVGWFKLARQYPDQGSLSDVAWHPAICWLDQKACSVIASANQQGLRLALSLTSYAVFVPWPDAAVSAKRGWLNTVIRIPLPESSRMILTIAADDKAADDLLRPIGIALLPREGQWCQWVWMGIGLTAFFGGIITVAVLCR